MSALAVSSLNASNLSAHGANLSKPQSDNTALLQFSPNSGAPSKYLGAQYLVTASRNFKLDQLSGNVPSTLQSVLTNAIDTGCGVFQFVSKTCVDRSKAAQVIESTKPTVSTIALVKQALTENHTTTVNGWTIKALDPVETDNQFTACAQITLQNSAGEHKKIFITEVGASFQNRLLTADWLEFSHRCFQQHLGRLDDASRCPKKNNVSLMPVFQHPAVLSMAGIGRSASMVMYNELRQRILQGEIHHNNFSQGFDSYLATARAVKGRFVHSAEQEQEIRLALMRLLNAQACGDSLSLEYKRPLINPYIQQGRGPLVTSTHDVREIQLPLLKLSNYDDGKGKPSQIDHMLTAAISRRCGVVELKQRGAGPAPFRTLIQTALHKSGNQYYLSTLNCMVSLHSSSDDQGVLCLSVSPCKLAGTLDDVPVSIIRIASLELTDSSKAEDIRTQLLRVLSVSDSERGDIREKGLMPLVIGDIAPAQWAKLAAEMAVLDNIRIGDITGHNDASNEARKQLRACVKQQVLQTQTASQGPTQTHSRWSDAELGVLFSTLDRHGKKVNSGCSYKGKKHQEPLNGVQIVMEGQQQRVNANSIQFTQPGSVTYIASECPPLEDKKITQFLTMLRQSEVDVLVSLINAKDYARPQPIGLKNYVPAIGQGQTYGPRRHQVSIENIQSTPLKLAQNKSAGTTETLLVEESLKTGIFAKKTNTQAIKRFGVTAWDDNQILSNTANQPAYEQLESLAEQIEQATNESRLQNPNRDANIAIHCRVGVGRTGTLICYLEARQRIRALSQQNNHLDLATVPEFVASIVNEARASRGSSFVSTPAQFAFLVRSVERYAKHFQ